MDVDGRATQEQLPSEAHNVPNNAHAACALVHSSTRVQNKTYNYHNYREVAEWLKAHAWKVCKPKGFVGSNPILSANNSAPLRGFFIGRE